MKKQYLFLSLLGILVMQIGFAQQKTITGTITDETGVPLPGATVIIENTTQGVSADFDGNFSIQASEGDVLLITYIGYSDYRVTVGNQDNLTISLSPDNELEEVVLTGVAGKTDTRKVSFAVGKVNEELIQQTPGVNPANALRSKVPSRIRRICKSMAECWNTSVQDP